MSIALREHPFDPWQELSHYEAEMAGAAGQYGASAVFVGTMRDFNEGDAVSAMTLEHYPGMTERHLESIAEQALGRWDILDVLVLHRVGAIRPGEAIVLVAVWSAHRRAAYEANRFIMEDLKSRAPFWKRESRAAGERWVEHNTPG